MRKTFLHHPSLSITVEINLMPLPFDRSACGLTIIEGLCDRPNERTLHALVLSLGQEGRPHGAVECSRLMTYRPSLDHE